MTRSSILPFAPTLLIALAAAAGCVQETDEQVQAPAPEMPSPWQTNGDGWQIALASELHEAELAQAIAKAQETAADARQQWLATPEASRTNWAVKWAAPLASNEADDASTAGVEHLWVTPLHWSPFRIEGVLVSQPVGTLRHGRQPGDMVSFPIEELTDWVHLINGDPNGERVGGFTIDSLEAHYGKPPSVP